MSLLTIVQDALGEVGGFEVPSSVVGNTNETAKRCLAITNRSLKETAKRIKWPGLKVRATLTTVASQEEYTLPSDFQMYINNTFWDDTNNRAVLGPASDAEWEYMQSSDLADNELATWFKFIRGTSTNDKTIYLYPIPSSVRTLYYWYKSDALTQTSGGTLQNDKFLADTDTATIDEDIVLLGYRS